MCFVTFVCQSIGFVSWAAVQIVCNRTKDWLSLFWYNRLKEEKYQSTYNAPSAIYDTLLIVHYAHYMCFDTSPP